jgi:hypothetical protein
MTEAGSIKFSIGRVIGEGLGVYARNFVSFTLLALLVGLIDLLVTIFYLAPNQVGTLGHFKVVGFDAVVAIFVVLLTYSLTQATIIYGAFQDLRGDRAGIARCLARGLTSIFPVIIGSIILWIAIGLASILLLIPGLIVMTMWWVYIPAIVVERKSIFESFGRSNELTSGSRWAIFGLIFIVYTLSGLVQFVTRTISVFVITMSASSNILLVSFITDYVGSSLTAAFGAAIVAVGYYHLRAEKEGVDANQIASVFD